MRRSFLFALILNLFAGATLLADEPAPTTQPAKDGSVIMTYDVSDLVRTAQDYPLESSLWSQTNSAAQNANAQSGGGGSQAGSGGSQGLFNGAGSNAPAPAPNFNIVTAETLIAVIKQMTQQNDLNISQLGKTLIVQATPDVHQKIKEMLNSMHNQQAAQSEMVCSRVYWLMLNPTEVAGIFEKINPAADGAPAGMPQVPDAMIDAAHLYSQAQTMCFNGQMVYVVAGRSQSYVSNLTPVVGQNAVGVATEISKALSGATLQIKPELLSGGKAVVDLASVVNEAAQPEKELTEHNASARPTTRPNSSNETALTLESVNVVQQEFHTTVRLPLGKKILVGGMTLEPALKDQVGRQLFLAIEVDAVQ